ncbi:MAG: FAD-binding oxidoreductase [Bacteroidota bacterium]|nr:FAD-binding oxidoreductase [Bacteroidota bacterium]
MQISIWEQESFFARKDVVIIGSGLAGLWCAYELLTRHPSLQLLILDKGIIPVGASTRNAGFACFGSPTELLHNIKTMGEERTWQLAALRYKGIQKTRRVLGDDAIDFDNCGGYECLRSDINNVDEVTEKLSTLNKGMQPITGEKDTFVFATKKLAQQGLHGFDALIENNFEGSLHSGKLVMALQDKIRFMGGQIMQGAYVERWEENNGDISIFITGKVQIRTSRLLICTNGLSHHLLPQINVKPARGQIIVTSPIDNLPLRGTFHFDEGFYYFRNIGDRVLLGGARNSAPDEEATASFSTTSFLQEKLEAFINTHILPKQSYKIDYHWSGIMGFTENRQPLIKPIGARVTAVVVCNGMGVALSPMMAEQIEL